MNSLTATAPARPALSLPAVNIVVAGASEAAVLTADGEIMRLPHTRAGVQIAGQAVMVCHAPYTRQRLGIENLTAFDVLELFAFVHPAKFCVPTVTGLAKALGLSVPHTLDDMPGALLESAQALLTDLQNQPRDKNDPLEVARVMGLQGKGWIWTPFVFAALGETYDPAVPPAPKTALAVWKHLPEWSEDAPPPPPSHHPVTGDESRARLQQLLTAGHAESRPQQVEYATALTAAFAPAQSAPDNPDETEPHIILAEAGTGVGKTAGYLAPASVWAEKNKGTVWISTYTKNLQRQVAQELGRLYPDAGVRDAKAVIRKGRENYLCLLNLEDSAAAAGLARHPQQAVAAGLMARWAGATKDGDLQGGDFPGWLPGLIGRTHSIGLADKRGECIYGACDHYHRCFAEKSVRRARHADIVVANHALVMTLAAVAGTDGDMPQRYVFDEGHHLFDAADSAFAAHLTARETADLRRWLLGPEGGRRSRARGLKRRVEELIAGDTESEAELQRALQEAHVLPAPGWSKRLKEKNPFGATEEFLMKVYEQVYARADGRNGPYALETDTHPLADGLLPKAVILKNRLRDIQKPLRSLSARLKKALADNAATWDSETRQRVEAAATAIDRRSEHTMAAWIAMLETLERGTTPPDFADWMEIERIDGQAYDIGLYRHWIDPMIPFAASLKPHAHGVAVTSATLSDKSGDESQDALSALTRTGAAYLSSAPSLFTTPSPYDYKNCTRVFVVTDVRKDDLEQVAAAYRVLFEAAGGGGLGLFTAINRLRAVHDKIHQPLENAGITLYAQHIDQVDTGTLVDIFREDTHACLLGTDAVRDGVDVPGDSLRLLIYDRVPWPRPTILHRTRRARFGGKNYDEMITRLKLRQAYGRLIRREGDRGVFVMMDSMLPSRLLTLFPEGVEATRAGLAETIQEIRNFLGNASENYTA